MIARKQDKTLLGLGLLVLILIIANSLVFYFRADLTRNGTYTISDVSKALFASMNEPVQLTYYVSGRLGNQMPRIQTIEDLLQEYSRLSNGKIEVHIVDTDGKEDQLHLEDSGIQAREMQTVDKNQVANTMVYSGIVIDYLNSKKVLPFVTDPEGIEYQLSSTIKSLVAKKNKVLGVLNGGTGQEIDTQYTALKQMFGSNVDVKNLQTGEAIPADVDVLFVFRDQTLSKTDALHIDQFIMSGKGVLLGVESRSVSLNGQWTVQEHPDSILKKLLESYGVEVQPGWVLDESNLTLPDVERQGQMTIQRSVAYPEWVSVLGRNMNQTNPLSARSSGIDLFWTSPLALKPGTPGEIIASSTDRGWIMKDNYQAAPMTVFALNRQQQSNTTASHGSVPVVVLRSGAINSYFADKDIKKEIPGITLPNLMDKGNDAHLLVIGSAVFASDLYKTLVQNGIVPSSNNIVFLQNAFDWLANDTDMLKLRTREIRDFRLTGISDPAVKDLAGTLALVFNAVLVPLGLIIFGVIRMVRRRNASRQERS